MNPLPMNVCFVSSSSERDMRHWNVSSSSLNASPLHRLHISITRRRWSASDIIWTLGSSANSE